MSWLSLHREDIKALLRKQYGSVAAFEAEKGLPAKSVSDLLRGRASAPTEAAIAAEIADSSHNKPVSAGRLNGQSDFSDGNTAATKPHRLTRSAR